MKRNIGSRVGNVHIIDSNPSVLNALDLCLRAHNFNTRTYSSTKSFLSTYRTQSPECLLVDIHMPHISGLQLMTILKNRGIKAPVIFLAGQEDVATAVQAIKSGATDFFVKPCDIDQLFNCINAALDSDFNRCFSHRESQTVANRLRQLTPRERQVLERVISGHSTKAIANDLGLSHRTIDFYRANMMRKMQTKSVVKLLSMLKGEDC